MPTDTVYAFTTDNQTLFDALLRLARELVMVRDGVATGGTVTTLIDTNAIFPIVTFAGGTIFLRDDAEITSIVSYTLATTTFTITTVATAPDAGDPYSVADGDIPYDVLLAALNMAIRSMTIPAEDASLVTVADQEEYTLPVTPGIVTGLYKVEVATNLTSPYAYNENFHWSEVNGKLRFSQGYAPATAGYKIRLTYRRPHTDLSLPTQYIPDGVNLDYLHWLAVQYCAKYGQHIHGADPKRDWAAKIQEAEVRLQRLASLQPKPQRSPRLADW